MTDNFDKNEMTLGRGRKFHISTFGCQMNVHDSEKLNGVLLSLGYKEAKSEEDANLVIFNTCCVRENAENRLYGQLGELKKYKRGKKDFKIALCGCMMQTEAAVEKIKSSYPYVDIIFGTYNLHRFARLLEASYASKGMIIDIWKERGEGDWEDELPVKRQFPFKAGVNIMYGCNNFCAYCIVPYVRGRERSREPQFILDEIKKLANDGVKEILLLGQNVNSYGVGLSSPMSFAQLLEKVSEIDNIERIRFMTSHPKDLSDELIAQIKNNPKVCKHLHLPVQAGSNNVLRAMNRKYSQEDYLALVDKLRRSIPDIALTTDIIVGFPGETESDFEASLEIVEKCRFRGAFTFYYSKRSGTPAANFAGQVPEEVMRARFDRLLNLLNPIVYSLNTAQEGKTVNVLFEGIENGVLTGRADDNSLVHCRAENAESLIGLIKPVAITEGKPFYLLGNILDS